MGSHQRLAPAAAAFRTDAADPRHGTPNGYVNLGCRCHRCRRANTDAHNAYMRAHREQRVKQKDREVLRKTGRDRRAEREALATHLAQTIDRVLGSKYPHDEINELKTLIWREVVELGHVR